ncbi:acetyl-CoA carboxylase biotin carboxyl carrier protein [Sporolactobacillus sp. Y61]|uniref:Biotin carboxyl carrier protein of acetyl-CoA carboxylase n=1 Tax=Sporolactobacillus sp. Y61 TaxID=3160863 RepID=A0AAU8IEI6_9BACL|nr:acetyl-CoA carboxylase biotin carboxyl carrier protein [Sporolactobacillus sp. THM19-2]RYL87845.1 acetyl-CoA carboxylase biotin carboxyl carrier protein [Sporolactobacillus sp. THM19-2]
MFSIDDIKALIKEIDSSSINELKIESEKGKLVLRKPGSRRETTALQTVQPVTTQSSGAQISQPAAGAPAKDNQADQDESLHKITSPMVGTFYTSSSPDSDPFVKKGSKVDKKTVVCIVEAMKLFNEIEAECKGTIVDVLAEDGQLVEYGQPLFLVKED